MGSTMGLRRVPRWAWALVGALFVVAAVYTLTLPLREDVLFTGRHPAYLVLVAPRAVVRTFPLHESMPGSVVYEHDAADGPAPARLTVTFSSRTDPQRALEAYAGTCSARGYRTERAGGQVECRAPGYAIAVGARPQAGGSDVTITFEEEP
jgi:hypothetical protein